MQLLPMMREPEKHALSSVSTFPEIVFIRKNFFVMNIVREKNGFSETEQ